MLCVTNMRCTAWRIQLRPSWHTWLAPMRLWTVGSRRYRATNPPSRKGEDGSNNFPSQYRTRETADLFSPHHPAFEADGRRVVLPDGTLFGEGVKTRLKEINGGVQPPHIVACLIPYSSLTHRLGQSLFFEKGSRPRHLFWSTVPEARRPIR